MRIRRLGPGDRAEARALFSSMAAVFDEPSEPLDDAFLDALLGRSDFWALAAYAGDAMAGGLTAHLLPMTRAASFELFIYDIAVLDEHRRKGIGRALVEHLRAEAARANVESVFVAADDEDEHALDFYRALGGEAAPVTMFTFAPLARPTSRGRARP